ncbi:MAG TPA: hydroxymethylbilane synthase, partial [Gammaproteobacteria bacterium]|nr:hydroxymethylbilane synthase [Gammaproteobacteria bacterium]
MSENKPLKLATRGSDLARAQSGSVAAALRARGITAELEIVATAGDLSAAEHFADIGAQGVFVREIEQAVIDGRADFAVHSFKDLPTDSPEALCIAAVPKRLDAHDVLLIRKDALRSSESFAPLLHHAKVGTSSARRHAWLRHFRRDVEIVPLRGNVPTRLAKLRDGQCDAILLAAAGLERLEQVEALLAPLLSGITVYPLDPERFVPAP